MTTLRLYPPHEFEGAVEPRAPRRVPSGDLAKIAAALVEATEALTRLAGAADPTPESAAVAPARGGRSLVVTAIIAALVGGTVASLMSNRFERSPEPTATVAPAGGAITAPAPRAPAVAASVPAPSPPQPAPGPPPLAEPHPVSAAAPPVAKSPARRPVRKALPTTFDEDGVLEPTFR